MKKKSMGFFWFGFVVSALSLAWLYWLWKRQREVTPGPLVISEKIGDQRVFAVNEGSGESRVGPAQPPVPAADVDPKAGDMVDQKDSQVDKLADLAVDKDDTGAPKKDRLERIKGIGPVTARLFNEAGVFTYTQLATLSVEQIEEIVDPGRWDPDDWISEARRFGNE